MKLFGSHAGAAADEYLHDFERRSDLEAWQPYTADAGCSLSNPGSGGNPGGYLRVRCTGEYVGAWTRSADFTGDLSASRWILSFDVANFGARHADLIDIIFFGGETAWVYYGTLRSAAAGAWTTYSLTFDPAWSDDEARANFWAPAGPDGASFASWASTVKRVDALGLRSGIMANPDASEVQLGIENVSLRSTP